jgi:hypothetical protein
MASLLKNVAGQNVTFCLVSSATGFALTVTPTWTSAAWVTKDGSQAAFAGTFTALGNGQYDYVPTQAETNCTNFGLFVAVTGAIPNNINIYTDTLARLTAAQIATGVWQDATPGDFTTASSVGNSLYNAFTSNTSVFTTASLVNAPVGSAPTAAAIATAVWQDAAPGDFTTASSVGKSLYNAFTSNTSVYTAAALANAPAPAAAAIATAVWQDATPGDFTVASSIGKSLYTSGILPGATGGFYLTGSTAITVSNVTQWNGSAVPVPNATGVPIVDMGYIRGVPSIGTAGSVGIDWSQVSNKTSTVALPNTTINTAAIASSVWQDATAGDFTVASSVGNSLYNAFTSNTSVFTTASLVNAPTGGSAPTAAAIATAVWQDATPGDFTVASSVGKSLYNAFVSNSSVYTTASLVNAPTGGSAPTAAAIATAVWQDTTSGDFTVASSIGRSLYTSGILPGAAGGHFIAGSNAATTVNITGNLTGTVSTVTTVTNQLTAAQIATGIWQDNTVGDFTTIGSIGRGLYTLGALPGGAGGLFIAGANVTTTVNFTGNLSGSVGSVSGLTPATIATGVWQDATAGDFTTAGSIGKSLGGAFTALGTSVYSTASLVNAPTGGSAPTAAAIATAVWQDATPGDFTVASSVGKSLYNAFVSNSSVYTTASLVNAPTGGSAPTAAAIATAVWQDTTTGDFNVAGSIGKGLFTSGVTPGTAGGLFIAGINAATTVNITGNITGTVSTVTTVTNQLTQSQIATGVWTDTTTSDFTVALSIGKSVLNGVALGTGLTINSYTGNTPQTGDSFARIGANGAGLTAITGVTLAASQPGVTIPTVTTVTNQLTPGAIAAGVWQDATAGDFTAAGSIGKSLGGAFTSLGTAVYSTASLVNAPTGGSAPTAAAVATAVWQDALGSDFTTANSIGKSLYNAFVSNSSVYTVASLVNAPTGGSAPTVAQIANAVWSDTISGDFSVAGSIGRGLFTAGVTPGSAGGLFVAGSNATTTVNFTGNLSGSVGSISGVTFPTNFGLLSIDTSGSITIKSNVRMGTPIPGFTFIMTSPPDHNPIPGLGSGVAFTLVQNGLTVASTSKVFEVTPTGNGIYAINLSSSDTNAAEIMLNFQAPGADATNIKLIMQP